MFRTRGPCRGRVNSIIRNLRVFFLGDFWAILPLSAHPWTRSEGFELADGSPRGGCEPLLELIPRILEEANVSDFTTLSVVDKA